MLLEQFFLPSPLGPLDLCIQHNKLYSISKFDPKIFKGSFNRSIFKETDKNLSYIIESHSQKVLKRQTLSPFSKMVKKQMENYFKGDLKKFDIPLSARGTDFQKKVWRALQKIQWGTTKTYGQVAKQLKSPKGSRAIGNCCAKNPFLIVVPCHRVLSQKGLGGFALGLKAKKQLLFLEKIHSFHTDTV